MQSPAVRCDHKVTLVGGGPVSAACLAEALTRAETLVAADGGADAAKALGQMPIAIIGDLDSLSNSESWRKSGISVHLVEDQNKTDFEKSVLGIDAPMILAVGFLGGRFDHALAVMSVLVAYPKRRIIVIGEEDMVFHCPDVLTLDLPVGCRVSFFPMAPVTGGESTGLRWPIDGLAMVPGGQIGTSNESVAERVTASFDGVGTLVILPLECLDAAIAALEGIG